MRRSEHGATLTELLAVTAMLTIVVIALVPLLAIGRDTWNRVDRHGEVTQNARRALDKLVRDVRAAGSFQVVSDSLIRLTMAGGDGSGATPTVEYGLAGEGSNLEVRASRDYSYRQRITVTNGSTAVPAGYTVSVTFNHAALVSAGKSRSDGNDVRIRYWDASRSRWMELDRLNFSFSATLVLPPDSPSPWNTTATRVWFRLQAPIAENGSDNNYYLEYGDLSADRPPANGDHVFQDYEDGTVYGTATAEPPGWTRRDTNSSPCAGTYGTSATLGFTFTSTSGTCYRQVSKAVAHAPGSGVGAEIIWRFRSDLGSATATTHRVGVSMRRNLAGAGYIASPGEGSNNRVAFREAMNWTTATPPLLNQSGTNTARYRVTPSTDFYGRFYVIVTTSAALRVRYWNASVTEPAWWYPDAAPFSDASPTGSGEHYAQIDGSASRQDHKRRLVILRMRVEPEPTTSLGPEVSGARADAWEPLAGPFRAMSVQCFDAAGSTVACPTAPGAAAAAVRSVQISLTTMDPTGEVSDIVVTSRAYRQAP